MATGRIEIFPFHGFPEVAPGDDLKELVLAGYRECGLLPEDRDVLVVTQKIVSKAEGRIARLADVAPSPLAESFARAAGRDPRLVELALAQARRIVRMDRGVLVTESRQGFVCANSGVDASNVPGPGRVALLPEDPDRSAGGLREALEAATSKELAVVISDTFGRPWREGAVNVAIGVSGLSPLVDYRGRLDADGRPIASTIVAVADELAGAAELVMGKLDRVPVALVRGFDWMPGDAGAKALKRPAEQDLFR